MSGSGGNGEAKPASEIFNEKTEEQVKEEIRARQEANRVHTPTVVVGFNSSGTLSVNIMSGTSPVDAIVMMQQLVGELLQNVKFQIEPEKLVKRVPGAALQSLSEKVN